MATLSHCVRIEPWSKLLILPVWAEYRTIEFYTERVQQGRNGGGGRIRTFEVDDGRFTVCSLWPLGNPARGRY
jgi:hypothetical protein